MAPEAAASRLARLEASKARRRLFVKAELEAEAAALKPQPRTGRERRRGAKEAEVALARAFIQYVGTELGLAAGELEDTRSLNEADVLDLAREMAEAAPHLVEGWDPSAGGDASSSQPESPRLGKVATDASTEDVEEEAVCKPVRSPVRSPYNGSCFSSTDDDLAQREEAPPLQEREWFAMDELPQAPPLPLAGNCFEAPPVGAAAMPRNRPSARSRATSSSARPVGSPQRSRSLPRQVESMLGEELLRLGALEFAKECGWQVDDILPPASSALGGGARERSVPARCRSAAPEERRRPRPPPPVAAEADVGELGDPGSSSRGDRFRRNLQENQYSAQDQVYWLEQCAKICRGLLPHDDRLVQDERGGDDRSVGAFRRTKKKKGKDDGKTIRHSLAEAQMFWQLGISPPNTRDDVPAALEEIEARWADLLCTPSPSRSSQSVWQVADIEAPWEAPPGSSRSSRDCARQ